MIINYPICNYGYSEYLTTSRQSFEWWSPNRNYLNFYTSVECGPEVDECLEIQRLDLQSQYFESNIITPAPTFSFFKKPIKNIYPESEMNLRQVYELIKGPNYQTITEELRSIKDKKSGNLFKQRNFDYVTFSGAFSKRSDDMILRPSNLIGVDFDDVSDIEGLKYKLLQDEYLETELMFISPYGNGVKWVTSKNSNDFSHDQFFLALQAYVYDTYGVAIDPSGKDLSRACFLPHDPNVYINPKY